MAQRCAHDSTTEGAKETGGVFTALLAISYVYNPVLGKALGVPQKGLLTRSAVPSLLAPSFPPQVPSQEQTSVSVSVES